MAAAGKLHPIAAVLIYGGLGVIVLGLIGVSTIANVTVWWNSAEGWHRYVFAAIGIAAEGWGALGLVLLTRRAAQGQWLRALVAFALWLPAVGFNGYSSYRYFIIEGSEVAAIQAQSSTEVAQARTREAELTADIDAIGPVRAPDAIQAEIDGLPANYLTKRRELTAELAEAERRAELVVSREQARAVILAGVGAESAPDAKAMTDKTVLAGLVIWMEAIKALALWIIFGRAHAPQKRQEGQEAGQGVTVTREPENVPPALSEAISEPLGPNERIIYGPGGEERRVRAL